jgi:hypothetical protein
MFPANIVGPEGIERRCVIKGLTLGAGGLHGKRVQERLEHDGAVAPRFVFVFESNGMWRNQVEPKNAPSAKDDPPADLPLSDLELPEPLVPLAPLKERMAIVLGLSSREAFANHGSGYGALGCYNARAGLANGVHNEALGQTIDHALAGRLPGVIPVVGLGISHDPNTVFANTVSAVDRKRPLPIVCRPEVAFASLFGSVAEGDAAKLFNSRQHLLDYIQADVRRVRAALPAMDREKLDAYLQTFEQMRDRQAKVHKIRDRLQANVPAIDAFNGQRLTDRFEAQSLLAIASLASGLTNVAIVDASCGPHGYKTWKELGVNMDGHAIGHSSTSPDSENWLMQSVIRQYHATRVADIATRLAAIPEAGGTMLDNTLIVWMSDSSDSHHGQSLQWPMILVGNLGGRLKTAGRFLRLPRYGRPGHRTMSDFYLALLRCVGDERETFGVPDNNLKGVHTAGPLADILA